MTTIQILGTGCSKCKQLQANAEQAVKELGREVAIEKVQDVNQITTYGVVMTPALAVDGQVKFVGKIASADEIAAILSPKLASLDKERSK